MLYNVVNYDEIITNWDDIYTNGYNNQNILRQIISTLRGLEIINTKYTIKVRSDEYYEDLSYFIDILKNSTRKLITNNVFFREDRFRRFHISDHVIGSTTSDMIRMFYVAKEFCERIKWNKKDVLNGEILGMSDLGFLSCEMLLCLCYLCGYNLHISMYNSKELMKKYVDVVSVSKMGKFLARCNYSNQEYISENEILMDKNGTSIRCMEEL